MILLGVLDLLRSDVFYLKSGCNFHFKIIDLASCRAHVQSIAVQIYCWAPSVQKEQKLHFLVVVICKLNCNTVGLCMTKS